MSYDAECYCNDLPADERCVFCEIETSSRLTKLIANLVAGAALCRSFSLGVTYADTLWDVEQQHLLWKPGQGKSADHECKDCGAPMLTDDVAQGFTTCSRCARERRATR